MIHSVAQAMLFAAVVVSAGSAVLANDTPLPKEVNVTIILRGADSDADVEVLVKALRTVKGVKVVTDGIETGFRKFNNRFTTPIVVTIPTVPGDDDANVGALAIAVSKAKTRNREKYPPGVNLVVFTDTMLDEQAISTLRSALSRVNGLEVDKPGGLGGNLQAGWCWIQLENAGGAMLKQIEQQTKATGTDYRRLQEAEDG